MELEQKSKEDIMEFFRDHHDFFTVYDISGMLVSHNNVQEEEIKNIKEILHDLKSDDFLLVKNEGYDIYNEKFSSTPDRVRRFFEDNKVGERKTKILEDDIWSFKLNFFGLVVDIKEFLKRIMNKNGENQETTPKAKYGKANKNDIPLWLKYSVAFVTIAGFFSGLYYYLNPNRQAVINAVNHSGQAIVEYASDETNDSATTTTDISELLSKALSLKTVLERQDLLEKYVGDQIHGKGRVKQISRLWEKELLVDIRINGQTISCVQPNNEENEKKLVLMKDKIVSFYGVFTYIEIPNHGLKIDLCVLQ